MTDDPTTRPEDAGDADASLSLTGFYLANGVSPGADLYVLGEGGVARAGEHAAILLRLADADGPAVDRVLIVLPPGSDEVDRHRVERGWRKRSLEFRETLGDAGGPPDLPARVRVVTAASLDAEAVAALVRGADARTAIVVAAAARYRAQLPLPDVVDSPEDVWVPHLVRLAELVVAAARATGAYVALEVDEWWPERANHREAMLGVEHCGVANREPKELTSRAMVERSRRWRERAASGAAGEALAEVDAAPGLLPARRLLERMAVLAAAGLPQEAVAALERERALVDAAPAEMRIAFAQAAASAGADAGATGLLAAALPGARTVESLQVALRVATSLGRADLEEQAEATLRARFERSGVLLHRDASRLIAEGRHLEAAALLDGSVEPGFRAEAKFQRWLGEQLATSDRLPEAVVAGLRVDWPRRLEQGLRAVAGALERAGRREKGLDLILAGPAEDGELDGTSLRLALAMMRRGLLGRDPACDAEMAVAVVGAGVRWLAAHPGDGETRLGLLELLSPEMLGGRTSLAVAAQVLTLYAGRALRVRPHVPLADRAEACDPDLLPDLLRRAFEANRDEPALVLGRIRLPEGDLPAPPESVVAALVDLIEHAGEMFAGDGQATVMDTAVLLAVQLAPLGTEPDQDLVALRAAAGRFAQFGRPQRARDMAEHVLTVAGDDQRRIRLAWHAFADIYARAGAWVEAILGLAAALASDDEVNWEQVWHESYLGVRLMRDVGLFVLAEPMLARAREALEQVDPSGSRAHWLETTALQVELLQLDCAALDEGTADALVERCVVNVRAVMAADDDPTPAVMLLASVARLMREAGLAVAAGADEAVAAGASRMGAAASALLSVTREHAPPAEVLVEIASGLAPARYAEDVGVDVRHLALGAERLLGSGLAGAPDRAAWAIEAQADHALKRPGGDHGVPEILGRIDGPARLARDLASEGLPLVMLGLARNGLTRVTFESGQAEAVVEPADTFAKQAFRAWRERYPYAYQDLRRDTSQDFFTSTERLGVAALPPRAVVVATAEFQVFPPGLLQVDRALAGANRPLATAPSLAWLAAAHGTPRAPTGRCEAWIPHPPVEEGLSALGVLASRIGDDLARHGVRLDTGAHPPQDLVGADLAIVAAHGGTGEDDHFFRSLADDDDLAHQPSELSRALAGAGIAVLFVCSGGRVDKHPAANATLGMARRLLGEGCRAVVAPPWPLDTAVPPRWLPVFLDRMSAGAAVVDACFDANESLRAGGGGRPVDHMAMMVFGDPLAAHPSGGSGQGEGLAGGPVQVG